MVKGIGSYSAAERVHSFQERTYEIANDRSFNVDNIHAKQGNEGIEILAGQVILLTLHEGDLELKGDERLTDSSSVIVDKIKKQIEVYRKQRSPHDLLFGALYSLVTLAVLFLLILGISKLAKHGVKLVESGRGKFLRAIKIRGFELLTEDRMTETLVALVGFLRWAMILLSLYLVVPLMLSFFPWTENLAPRIVSYVTDPLLRIGHVIANYLPNLFFIVVIVYVTRIGMKILKFFFNEIGKGHVTFEGFHREWAEPTYKLARTLLLILCLIVSFPYLPGSSSPAFQGISVFLGVLISLGSSSAVSNIVAGVVLTYMRPFIVGDRVEIAGTTGDIVEKTLLVTRIRSIKNVEITVPNSLVLSSHIFNFSSSAKKSGLILNTSVTIGYDVPWRKVHDLLREAAVNTNLILEKPEPFVLQTSLNDFNIAYQLNAYTNEPNKSALIYSLLHQNIQDSFATAGIEIMSPNYLAMRSGEESTVPSKPSKLNNIE